MTDSNLTSEIARHMANTARAHHEATGGVNPQWADWYAERLVDDVNEALGSDMDVAELAAWLADADRRYREEPREESWPKVYAGWLIAEHLSDS
jgi:NAD(P)-dependent dehydrogenase (short-subunit alcohol dehydrogenase family)